MRTQILKPNPSAAIGLLLTVPTAYFIVASILKYALGLPALLDAIQPTLENLGIKDSMGWNINLLILFGPLIALLLNATSILRIEWKWNRDEFIVLLQLQKKWNNWIIILLSGLCLLSLFFYLVGENCK